MVCQGESSNSRILRYPLSVFNKNSTLLRKNATLSWGLPSDKIGFSPPKQEQCGENKVVEVRGVKVLKTRVRVYKIHLREGVEEWPDLDFVGSQAAMDVRLFPHGTVGGSLSHLLVADHAKCMHNQLQTAQQ